MAFKQVTLLDCPICPFSDTDENILTLHIEHLHFSDYATGATNLSIDSGKFRNENQRRYPVDDADFADVRGEPNPYLPCPESDCGEEVLWLSLQEHLDLHIAEGFNQDSPTGISSLSAVPYVFCRFFAFLWTIVLLASTFGLPSTSLCFQERPRTCCEKYSGS